MCVCVCACACVCVCVCVCVREGGYVCGWVDVCGWVCVYIYVCLGVCVDVCFNHLSGLVVKKSALNVRGTGFKSQKVIPVTLDLAC